MAKPACVEYFTLDQAAEFASGTFTHNFSTIHFRALFGAMRALLTEAMSVRVHMSVRV
jgi:hypothetical protein